MRKTSSKNNSSALSKLRQRLKKYNKDFEKELLDFKNNPHNYPEEEKIASVKDSDSEEEKSEDESSSEESSSEEESDDEPKKVSKEKKVKKKKFFL